MEPLHEPGCAERAPGPSTLLVAAVVASLVALALAAASFTRAEHRAARSASPAVAGLPQGTIADRDLFRPDDPWAAYLADGRTCPGGARTDLPLVEQATVMVCLIDYARSRRGLGPLAPVATLDRSAVAKAERIIRCRAFGHEACGDAADAEARALGYDGAFGENLYIAENGFRSPRAALDGWLNSSGHRENLFRPQWRVEGVAVVAVGRFGPYLDAALWVNQFGT